MAKTRVTKDARTTPAIRVSFPQQLFTPKSIKGGEPKYGVALMFDKSDTAHMDFMKGIHADMQAALAEYWPDESARPRNALIGETLSPIKDGDVTVNKKGIPLKEKNPEYAGHYIIRVNSSDRPVVVDKNRQEIIDSKVVYGGCFCKVNINAYTYDGELSQGVTIGLNGVQKWADGESFGAGRPAIDSMFEAAPGGSDDEANYNQADPFAKQEDSSGATSDPFG